MEKELKANAQKVGEETQYDTKPLNSNRQKERNMV